MPDKFLGYSSRPLWRLALLSIAAAAAIALHAAEPPSPQPLPANGSPAATPFPISVLQKKIDFQADLLPILKRNCLACHNATDAEADLVLETPATILKGGENGPVVVPKKGLESLLVKSAARAAKPHMPPKNNKVGAESLKSEELAILRTWIDQGATGTVTNRIKPVQWRALPPGLHPILAVAVTSEGQFAACGRANQIFIYHVPTGQVVARLTDPKLAEKANRSGYRSSAQRDFVQSLAFSPDGRLLASGEYRAVKLWQRDPNLPQFTLGKTPATVLAASADGKWLATAGGDRVIRLWAAATGQPGPELAGHAGAIVALQFSPDSTRLASADDTKSLRVWDVATGHAVAHAEPEKGATAAAWIFGGKQLASAGDDGHLRLWALPAAGEETLVPGKEFPGPPQAVTQLEAMPDGKHLLAGSRDGSARIWDVEGGRFGREFKHGAPVSAVAVAAKGKIVATAGGTYVRLWNAETGQQIAEMKGDPRARLQVTKNEQEVAFAKTEIAYWKSTLDAATKVPPAKNDAGQKAAQAALAAAKAGAERAAAALPKATADLEEARRAAAASEKAVRTLAFSPDGSTLATSGDDQVIHTWSGENGGYLDTFPSQLGSVGALTYLADGRLVSSAAQKGTAIWHAGPTWTLARIIGTGDEKSPLSHRVLALAFSPDGQILATGGGVPSRSGEVKLWRPADGTLIREITPSHSDTVFGLDFSPDGKFLATGGADKFVKIFETASGHLVKALAGHTHYVLSVNWRADGRTLASSGADKVVKLWSFPDGEQLKTVEGFQKEVTSIRFVGLGGEMLAAAGEARVRLLKEDGSTLRELGGSKGYIFSTAITPDGRLVLGGGQDSVLRAWDYTTGKSLFNVDAPPAEADPR